MLRKPLKTEINIYEEWCNKCDSYHEKITKYDGHKLITVCPKIEPEEFTRLLKELKKENLKYELSDIAIIIYIFVMTIIALLPIILGVSLAEKNLEPWYILITVFEIPLIPSMWVLHTKIWVPFTRLIGRYHE